MEIAHSRNGVPIRLPEDRWEHIVRRHPEMRWQRVRVMDAIAAPDIVHGECESSLVRILEKPGQQPDRVTAVLVNIHPGVPTTQPRDDQVAIRCVGATGFALQR